MTAAPAHTRAKTPTASARQPLGTLLRAHLACARMEFRAALTYRTAYLSSFVMMLLQIWLLTVVWKALYDGRAEVDGLGLTTMTAYATLTTLQYQLVSPWRSSPSTSGSGRARSPWTCCGPSASPGRCSPASSGGHRPRSRSCWWRCRSRC